MARAYLARSLNNLFNEIDTRWPRRDRKTDGWYTSSRVSYGHNRRERGLVHAIDVDDDGISEDYIIDHIYRGGGILWYVIWNRRIWSSTYGFKPRAYKGSNPHTDHMHIEIHHTTKAENYSGHWGIAPGDSGMGHAPGNPDSPPPGTPSSYSPPLNYDNRDYQAWIKASGNHLDIVRGNLNRMNSDLARLRR